MGRVFFYSLFESPRREYILAVVLCAVLGLHYFDLFGDVIYLLWAGAILGSIVPLMDTFGAIRRREITIEAFNFFALLVCFVTGEITSAIFIALMLTFASYLDWRTESRASNAVEELLKLKPNKAYREKDGALEEIPSEEVHVGDILVVRNGERVPVDGVVVFGSAFMNEASLTGESAPTEKIVGDSVYSSTLSETGVIKIRATKVGSDSTIERMAALITEAGKQKSKAQRLADKFAGIFLPVVVLAGIAIYVITKDIRMTAAFFLVVCADDIAVSIPLAVTASLGGAAKRGVIIKGGEWLDALAKVKILAIDKTGTLTYGTFTLEKYEIAEGVDPHRFWMLVSIAEKFSEHPVGRAIFREATKHDVEVCDPDEVHVMKGAGIRVRSGRDEVVIGNEKVLTQEGLTLPVHVHERFDTLRGESAKTVMLVFINKSYAGMLLVADVPRAEAKESIRRLEALGVRVIMLTGDNESVAKDMSERLGITEYRAGMTPEGKMDALASLAKEGSLAMVGDGINDAPALARADVGIAMGAGGTAVAVETANIVILTDELDRIPEMILLARRTVSVVNGDMAIWFITNAVGVALVFMGIAGPALAAFYNFATDFLPLLNSARLFRGR
jgi:Cd2+/Zn2+-exporting ATPase